jgi:hypothetical protein
MLLRGTSDSYLLQAFEETPTHMSIKINRLEEGHNSYPLVCRRPTETVSLHVLSINNSRFAEFLPLIYPPELEVKFMILKLKSRLS